MKRKTKKERDEYLEKVIREAREHHELFVSLPPREGAALRRARSLERTLKLRYWLKHGNGRVSEADLLLTLKLEQSILVDCRRYRETGIWPTKH